MEIFCDGDSKREGVERKKIDGWMDGWMDG